MKKKFGPIGFLASLASLAAVCGITRYGFAFFIVSNDEDVSDFETKALAEIAKQNEAVNGLGQRLDDLDGDTKKALEDFTTLKNDFDGLGSQYKSLQQSYSRLNLQMNRERKMANSGGLFASVRADKDLALGTLGLIKKSLGLPLGDRLEDAVKAITTTSDVGSKFVVEEIANELYDAMESYGAFRNLGFRRLGRKTTRLLTNTQRPKAVFIGEGITVSRDTRKAVSATPITLKALKVLLYISEEELLEPDAFVALDILNQFAQAMAERMDFISFAADGTADEDHGGFTSLTHAGAAAVAANGRTRIELTQFEDWLAVQAGVDEYVLSRDAKWFLTHRNLLLASAVRDDKKNSIMKTALEVPTGGALAAINGYGVQTFSAEGVGNTAGERVASFGDPMAAVPGLRSDFRFDESKDAGFDDFTVGFRGLGYGAFGVRHSGAFAALQTAAS